MDAYHRDRAGGDTAKLVGSPAGADCPRLSVALSDRLRDGLSPRPERRRCSSCVVRDPPEGSCHASPLSLAAPKNAALHASVIAKLASDRLDRS
jgi:hypothetical protein